MARYDYECLLCKQVFEVDQKMNDPLFKTHVEATQEKCNGEVQRIITGGSGVIFKGTGWTPKHYTKTGKKLAKLDNAISQMGVEDESQGWTKE